MKTMKVYTIEDLKSFDRDESGRLICPTGDYRSILWFKEPCEFDQHCLFGVGTKFCMFCIFGRGCKFGPLCRFGNDCYFDELCTFDRSCSFGFYCGFGDGCRFSNNCKFAADCAFGPRCKFGAGCLFGHCCTFNVRCSFGKVCHFGEDCSFSDESFFGEACHFGLACRLVFGAKLENKKIKEPIERVLQIEGAGPQGCCTYFFKTSSEIYVRCGDFFGTIAEFEATVKAKHSRFMIDRGEYLETIKYVKSIMK